MARSPRLKLRAHDATDMDVIASVLQDALVPLTEVTFLRRDRRFVMVVNRFLWEGVEEAEGLAAERVGRPAPDPAAGEPDDTEEERARDAAFHEAGPRPTYYRTHCGVTFDKVEAVKIRGIDQRDRNQILNLLTIATEPKRVDLRFSDGGRILLAVSAVRCHLEDFDEPWPTWSRPDHGARAAAGGPGTAPGPAGDPGGDAGGDPGGDPGGDAAPDLDGAKPAR
ncbi:MAG: DUF2948 family protein [Tistlia sp.]|uniref:DUF2948 family protein n=1 Tax=Tistlia sp. TaxID=3057121 RepID=UPI0034A27795